MKFDILNRWTGKVQFTAEIDATEDAPLPIKIGLSVRWGLKNDADLRDADLRDADLRDADLSGADLRDADLRDADLSGAVLQGANLYGAELSGAVLQGANLRDAEWMPRIPNIHSAVYAAAAKPGALNMGVWHEDGYCGTTHCRAGWAVVLAGPGGRALEGLVGTPTAAALIYQASDPALERVPDFYATNEAALADMKRLADAEAAQ